MEINCEARFEAAHRLSFYDGKCNRLHGHNWLVKLRIESPQNLGSPILFDFTHLKKIVNLWDHKTLLFECAINIELFELLPPEWVVWLHLEPTAENMANLIIKKIIKDHPEIVGKFELEVWENDKSYAVARRIVYSKEEDNP